MSKEDIISEIEEILRDADGYDIDPYIPEQLLTKIKEG